jgi:putative glutamine amidotransferase
VTRPLIAVPAYPRLESSRVRGWSGDGVGAPARYVDALHRAGAREALFLPEPWSVNDAADLLRRVDGLLLIGGGDLDPSTYGHAADTTVYGVDAGRDACELALAEAALRLRVPTLAICRGHQVLAVALGGALDQDIAGRPELLHHGVPGVEDGARLHEVRVEPGSRLASTLGAKTVTVSSHHHQAVTDTGRSRVVGRAPDDVVEAIEPREPDGPWVVGVQWHPEDTAGTDPVQQRLFDGFVNECRHRDTAAASPAGSASSDR